MSNKRVFNSPASDLSTTCDSLFSSDNDADVTHAPGQRTMPCDEAREAPPHRWIGTVLLWAFHIGVFASFALMTWMYLLTHSVLSYCFSGTPAKPVLERRQRRITPGLLDEASDPAKAMRDALPVPPPFPNIPAEGITISFGPCANLMIYLGGVCCCLQRCPNWKSVAPKIRFYGCSCGAIMAAMMAADVDMMSQVDAMWKWTARYQTRLCGLVGAYSSSIADIIRDIFADPDRFVLAKDRLSVGATRLAPAPEHVVIDSFDTHEELTSCVLGSCYIPVAFEEGQWSKRFGPLLDGGILGFQVNGDVVVSPYEHNLPDIGPKVPHPRSLVFFPPHKSDALHLFEEGYTDCLAWLAGGGQMQRPELREKALALDSGFGSLVAEAWRFLGEVACGSIKS